MDQDIDRELGKIGKELLACVEAARADDEAMLVERLKVMGDSALKLHDALKTRRAFEGEGGNQR